MGYRVCWLLRERVCASRCVAMDARLDSDNPAFRWHATMYLMRKSLLSLVADACAVPLMCVCVCVCVLVGVLGSSLLCSLLPVLFLNVSSAQIS
jgi:hypothetical protein